MSRSADALWLGDQAAAARNIWKILAAPQGDLSQNGSFRGDSSSDAQLSASIRLRGLYNLAATAGDQREAAAWLERLFAEGQNTPVLPADPCFYAGIIRYTRLLDTNRALTILTEGELQKQPLPDLELLRRRSELLTADRTVAETWLLLGRHPEEAVLYQWGAYFFDRQRKYDESALLLKTAERHQIGGPWLDLNAAIRLIEEGRFDEAEAHLRAIPPAAGIWQANANLARLLEARQAPAAALEYYETAASLVKDPESASLIQLRIAGCLQVLGRIEESRRVLEYALDLNPNNLKARMELRKISNE
jgi:tetratricopeptide (TPR) repeat protein